MGTPSDICRSGWIFFAAADAKHEGEMHLGVRETFMELADLQKAMGKMLPICLSRIAR